MKQRDIRVQTLQTLYQMEFQKEPRNLSQEVSKLVQSVLLHKEKIDQTIQKHSKNWEISRIALLDLNILRIAVYEMLFSENKTSSKVFINEAVEISKEFSSKQSHQFINGILDPIAKESENV